MEDLTKTGIKPFVLEEIKRIAEAYGVKKVILFGSRAAVIIREPAILIW